MASQRASQRASQTDIVAAKRAIATDPTDPGGYGQLGNALRIQGEDLAAAGRAYRRALLYDPNHLEALVNLAGICHRLGDRTVAIDLYRRALDLTPHDATLYYNLGILADEIEDYPSARSAYECAVRCDPSLALAHYRLARLLLFLADAPEQAVAACQAAIDYGLANEAAAHANLGVACRAMGWGDRAIAAHTRAIELDPDHVDAHFDLGCERLMQGDFAAGWPDYAWRLKQRFYKPLIARCQPMWQGEDLPDQTLLIHEEQGFGDTLQFIRYIPEVAQRVGRMVVCARRSLFRLLETVPGIDQLVEWSHWDDPQFDAGIPLLHLPMLLNTTVDTIPAPIPYLIAPAPSFPVNADSFPPTAMNLGLVWASGYRPEAPELLHAYEQKSTTLATIWEALHDLDHPETGGQTVTLHSLQVGQDAAQIGELGVGDRLIDWGAKVTDFGDTAAIIKRLDAVITIDTAVAHLAGALGKPVLVLLPYAADWRWLRDRTDSPWYPTMRLFRQTERGSWAEPLAAVRSFLENGELASLTLPPAPSAETS